MFIARRKHREEVEPVARIVRVVVIQMHHMVLVPTLWIVPNACSTRHVLGTNVICHDETVRVASRPGSTDPAAFIFFFGAYALANAVQLANLVPYGDLESSVIYQGSMRPLQDSTRRATFPREKYARRLT